MKKFFEYLLLGCAAIAMAAGCAKEPAGNDPGKDGEKSKERTLLTVVFEGQIGEAVITTGDASTGEVAVQIATDLVKDMTKVAVNSLTCSYGATSSVKAGDTIDLSKAATIVITAESGDIRTYAVKVETFSESLAGFYSITGSMFVGGVGVVSEPNEDNGWSWGCCYAKDPADMSWCWDQNGYGPTANYDDYFELKCTKINDDGTTEGTCKMYGGVDGKHWNGIYAGKMNKVDEGLPLDLRFNMRVIPIGESTWKRNYEEGTITFKDKAGKETVAQLVSGTVEIAWNKSFDVPDQAFVFRLEGDQNNWDEATLWTDYHKFVVAPFALGVYVSKVDAIPAESMTEGDEGPINLDPETIDTPKVNNLKAGEVYINECDCTNKKLEIYNPGDSEIDLAYAVFMKDGDTESAWTVPAENFKIPAKGFIVLTLKNTSVTAGPTFGMSETKGFVITITTENGVIETVDNSAALDLTGVTYGRKTDGGAEWVVFSTGTIGSSNINGVIKTDGGDVKQSDLYKGQIYINECDPDNKKIEIYNATDNEIDMEGVVFTKDGTDKWIAPAGAIPAKGFKVYTVKNDDVNVGPTFGMSATKGFVITLTTKNGEIDKVDNSEKIDLTGCTYGREDDGYGDWVVFSKGTIGSSNFNGEIKGKEVPESFKSIVGIYKVSKLMVQGPMWSGAFVDAKDKDWEWNGTINKEYDNLLKVKYVNAGASTAEFQIEYTGGADAGFWDRVLVADKNKLETGDADLSANFDRLPHEVKVTASLDMAQMIISYNNGAKEEQAKVLVGEQSFTVGGATLNIEAGKLGLAYATTAYDESAWNASWEWSDFDRFFFHPVSYVMVFTKQ